MALIRKMQAGSDSFGHVWPEDGAVVEIDDAEQIACLMAISDAGFSEVTPSGDDKAQQDSDDDPEAKTEISEIDPNAPATEPDAKQPAKRTAARKTAAGSQSVGE